MGRRPLLVAASLAGGAALALFGPRLLLGQEAPPPPAVPADRLPVLGTVGDLPPESERVVVELTAEPALSVRGRRVDLSGFQQLLRPLADSRREEDGANASLLSVVLRVDRAACWQDVQWVLQACADPGLRIYRTLFAALPEDGGEEGAMALYLPTDAGLRATPSSGADLRVLPVRLRDRDGGLEAPARAVYAGTREFFALRPGTAVQASLDADAGTAAGVVLQAADALLRGGATGLTLRGTTLHKAGNLPARRGSPATRPVVLLADSRLAESGAAPLPVVARVTGGLAGLVGQPRPFLRKEEGIREDPPGRAPRRIDAAEKGEEGALDWLKRRQAADGSFGPRPGDTGLALLAFLGAGETHRTPRFGAVVRGGLKHLKRIQNANGSFGPPEGAARLREHALAALAMAEAFGTTQSPLFKTPAQQGVDFAVRARGAGGGWDGDAETTVWMLALLRSAKGAGLSADDSLAAAALAWVEGSDASAAATGAARAFAGKAPAEVDLPEESLRHPLDRYLGTVASFHGSGAAWNAWHPAMKEAILAGMVADPESPERGGWIPSTPAEKAMGPVRLAALNLMSLRTLSVHRRAGRGK